MLCPVPARQKDEMTDPAQVSLIATDSIQDLLQVVPDATARVNPNTFAIEQRKDKQLTAVIRFLKDGTRTSKLGSLQPRPVSCGR